MHHTQSQYTDTGLTSPSADPITPGAWQGSHWSANFEVTGMTRPEKSRRKRDSNPRSSAPEVDALTTRPTRLSQNGEPQRYTVEVAYNESPGAFKSDSSNPEFVIIRRAGYNDFFFFWLLRYNQRVLSLSLSLSHSLSLSLCHTLSLSHTHTYTRARAHTRMRAYIGGDTASFLGCYTL